MTLDDLLTGLLSSPGARAVPSTAPLRSAVVAGVEVARTDGADDRSLRSAWRGRHGGGATPLLLLADEPGRPGCVRALGLVDSAAPVRTVDVGALASALARLASLPRLEAVRELASELDRLDQAGIPGLKLRELLTLHTLNVRLRGDAIRWGRLVETTKGVPRSADWRGVLVGLGYEIVRRPVRGSLVRFDGRPVAVVHPRADPAEFARLSEEGRPPEGLLLNDCAAEGVAYGLLASGGRLRLFDASPATGSAAARYLDLDAAVLQDDDRPFLGLLGPAYLDGDDFAALQREASDYGAGLRTRLDHAIRQRALPALGLALGRWARDGGTDPAGDAAREELERAALTLVFRALFILYAEAAGYLPMDSRAYEDSSLTRLVQEAADGLDGLDPRSTSLWDRFTLLVKAMRTGNRSRAWGVPAHNGALFAANGFDGAATLERVELADPDFARVLVGIGRPPGGDIGLDYSTLQIGHLGNIYEGLLSLRLSVAEAALSYDAKADRYGPATGACPPDVEPGDLLWQTHEGGRKGGGVYYTRSELVRHLVRHVPLLRTQGEADLLAKLRQGSPFPRGPGRRWRSFPVAELHETNDSRLWQGAEEGQPLWKGESFDQYDAHGAEARSCPLTDAVLKKVRKPRPGSFFARELPAARRARVVLDELSSARVVFRDVSRATDSRTVRAALVPPGVLLTNKAPYLAFVEGGDRARSAALAVMNSLPFDWQARRFVEVNLNFFILEGLVVPDLDDTALEAPADAAARLSCVDERFAAFADSFRIEPGPLPDEERERLRVEIDARVAAAWRLTGDDLDVLLADFTADAVPPAYRWRLADRLGQLSSPDR